MADNVQASDIVGSSGPTFAADDIAGIKFPRSKITIGADGTNDGDVSSANPMPVSLASVPSHSVNAGTNLNTSALALESGGNLAAIAAAIFAEDAASANADKGVQVLTVRKDTASATSGTTGDYQPPISNARGATWVAVEDGSGGQVTSFVGTQYTEDAAAPSDPVGPMMMARRRDGTSSEVSADGDLIAVNATPQGGLFAALQPNNIAGLNWIKATGSIGATVTTITTAVCALGGWYIFNPNNAVVYVQLFNTLVGSVTLGSTAPYLSFGIPPNSAANVLGAVGVGFSSCMSIAITTTRDGNTGPSSTVDFNIFYRT